MTTIVRQPNGQFGPGAWQLTADYHFQRLQERQAKEADRRRKLAEQYAEDCRRLGIDPSEAWTVFA